MNEQEIIGLLSQKIKGAESQTAWAREHKISQTYVSLVLAGKTPPGWKILDALGYERVITYRRKAP